MSFPTIARTVPRSGNRPLDSFSKKAPQTVIGAPFAKNRAVGINRLRIADFSLIRNSYVSFWWPTPDFYGGYPYK